MTFSTLLSFLPWITFYVLSGRTLTSLTMAALIALLLTLTRFKELCEGFILTWGSLLFFLFVSLTIGLWHNTWIAKHMSVLASGTLAAIAWTSLFVGRPFTLQYARKKVPPQNWNSPLFIRINQLLTLSFGIVFLFNTLVALSRLYYPTSQTWIYSALFLASIVWQIRFIHWFPNWYKQKYQEK